MVCSLPPHVPFGPRGSTVSGRVAHQDRHQDFPPNAFGIGERIICGVKAENKVLGLACPLTLYLAFVRGPEGVMVELVQRCATADSG
jgi:hypothetical protein